MPYIITSCEKKVKLAIVKKIRTNYSIPVQRDDESAAIKDTAVLFSCTVRIVRRIVLCTLFPLQE